MQKQAHEGAAMCPDWLGNEGKEQFKNRGKHRKTGQNTNYERMKTSVVYAHGEWEKNVQFIIGTASAA